MDVTPLSVEDSVTDNEDISWVVFRLHLNRSGGPSCMQAEHLFQWLQEATQEKEPGATHFLKVVAILQAELRDGKISNKSTCQTLVLIQKGDGGYFWGIDLVEVLWKTVTGILNLLFTLETQSHDILHGF